MVVRKLDLAEWFIRYQLLGLQKHHFYNPFFIEIDARQLLKFYGHEKKIPLTAILIKAAALLQQEAPDSHRVIVPSFWGPRMIEFSQAKVNVPILLERGGKQFLSAVVIENANSKGPLEILNELREKVQFDKKNFPICNFISNKRNNFFNRLVLRCLYALAYRIPFIYKKKGGGISVSAVSSSKIAGRNIVGSPMGPTALTLGLTGLDHTDQGTPTMKLGIGYDHSALLAVDATRAMAVLSDMLSGKDQKLFNQLTAGDQTSTPNHN